jgi:hypothetical protein
VSLTVSGATDQADADDATLKSDATWDGLGGSYPVSAGSSMTLDDSDFDSTGASLDQLDLRAATVEVFWTSQGGENSGRLAE